MNKDERRRIEREVKEYNRNREKFESRTEKSLVSKTLGAAGNVAKSAAVIGSGLFLAKKGWQDYGRVAAKDFLGSKTGSGFISSINKRLDDSQTMLRAFNETAKQTGIINTIKGNSNREFAMKIAEKTKAKSIRPSGMANIKSNIEKVASEYSNVREEIMKRTISGVQKEEFHKKVLKNAADKNFSKKDKNTLDAILNAIRKKDNTSDVNRLFTFDDGATMNKHDVLSKVIKKTYGERDTGKLPIELLNAEGEIDSKFFDVVLEAANDVSIEKEFYSRDTSPTNFFKVNDKSSNFLKQSGVSSEISSRYNKLISKYNQSIGELLSKKDGETKKLVNRITNNKSISNTLGIDTDIGLRQLTIREARERGFLDYTVTGSLAKDGVTEDIGMSSFIDEIEASMQKDGASILDSVFDPSVYINDANEIVDMRMPKTMLKNAVNSFADNVQVPFLNFNPVKLIRDMFVVDSDMPITSIFRTGQYMPSINNTRSIATVGSDSVEKVSGLAEDYFYFAGNLYNNTGDFIRKGYLYSSDRGLAKNTFVALSNNEKKEYKNKVFEFLDVGAQTDASVLKRNSSVITKFDNPYWQPNILKNIDGITGSVMDKEYINRSFKSFYTTTLNSAKPLSTSQLESLRPIMEEVFFNDEFIDNLIQGSTDKNILDTIRYLVDNVEQRQSGSMFSGKLKTILAGYDKDPENFMNKTRTRVRKQEEWAPASLESLVPSKYDNISAMDEAKIYIHAEVLNRIQNKLTLEEFMPINKVLDGDLIAYDRAHERLLEYLDGNTKNVDSMLSLSFLQKIGGEGKGKYVQGDNLSESAALNFLQQIYSTADSKHKGATGILRDVIKDNNSIFDFGPDEIGHNPFSNSNSIFVGRASHGISNTLANINARITMGENPIEAVFGSAFDNIPGFMREIGFGSNRVGRGNLEEMSRAGMVSYQLSSRLNTLLSQAGIGLSSQSMGSAQDVWINLAMKRIIAPMTIGGYALYANDAAGEVFGEKPTQTVGQAYATTTVGMSGLKQVTGINALYENLDRIMPGASRIFETPLGKLAETATFGFIGSSRDSNEQTEYLTEGFDPVRKGRYWGFGSNTPFWGDRIRYHQPSWYRRLMSDYKYTDVYYGEGMERWENSVLPTLHNPIGALNPLTWNHYDIKHQDSRPYPTRRSMFANVPLVGDLLDQTVGRITTPRRNRSDLNRQHEAYLKEMNMLTAYYGSSQISNSLQLSAGGRMTPVVLNHIHGGASYSQGGTGAVADVKLLSSEEGEGYMYQGGATTIPYIDASTYAENQGPPTPMMIGGDGYGSIAAREALTSINMNYVNKSEVGRVNVGAIASLKNNNFVDDLSTISSPNSLLHGLGRTVQSFQDIEGIYGWMSGFVTGDTTPRHVLASSSSMMSISRQWWDSELGGDGFGIPGGDGLSELYRRFIPKQNKGQITYNPIRNEMPSWLPGPEYFTDFKHGDAFGKVYNGEYRLPGEGYESMNKLYSDDIFGYYGAVDRMLILSDIAPYSEQYSYYSKTVSKMREEGMVSDEAWEKVQDAKERLREVKKKHDFHPYKFKTADVERQTVTVTKRLDDTTFMVDALPGTPLKLAGLGKLPKGREDDKANRIRSELNNVIRPGEQIDIGLAVDRMNAYNSDVRGTMDAVVYTGFDNTLNRKVATIAGESLFGFGEDSPIDVKWDSTDPTDVAALYSRGEIRIGRAWENFSHMNIFLHSKFLPIRSPLEVYKRKELYG